MNRCYRCYYCYQSIDTTENDGTWAIDAEYGYVHNACFDNDQATSEFFTNLHKPRYVVIVYRCTRSHGGPEEGGWSYEEGERVLDADFHSQDAACTVARGLEIEYPYTGKRGSVLGGDDYTVVIYDRHEDAEFENVFDCRLDVIQHYPVNRPHYE